MAGNFLNSGDATLKALLANGLRYVVPPYQRDYSWREEQWEDLWRDIEQVAGDGDRQHYMGALVLEPRTREEFSVIDGQQRLCTLSIVVLAAVSLLLEREGEDPRNRDRAELLRSAFVSARDPDSLIYSSKLTLNRNNDPFYQGKLVQLEEPASVRKLSPSERLMWGAFGYFRQRLAERFPPGTDGGAVARFVNEEFAARLLFIRVQVDDELSAYTVFETLNARGLDLTAGDLLKNYLMSIAGRHGQADLDHVMEQWTQVSERVGHASVPEFLRHHLNSRSDFVRQDRLFKSIRDSVKDLPQVLDLLRRLEKDAVVYEALDAPEDPFWLDYPGAREPVRVLGLLGAKQYKPLVLAAARRFPASDELGRILRLCVAATVRYTLIAERNPSGPESAYSRAALGIETGKLARLPAVREALSDILVSDDEFRDLFWRKSLPASGQSKKKLRYLLCEIERHAGGADVNDATCEATIEHILPQEQGPDWDQFPAKAHEQFVDRLGNHALLEADLNREAGRKPYDRKRALYAQSRYATTKSIAAPEWNPSALDERQRKMAEWAVEIWRP